MKMSEQTQDKALILFLYIIFLSKAAYLFFFFLSLENYKITEQQQRH